MLTDLLEAKWQLFGNWCMWVELAMYLVLMVITTLLVMAKRPGGEFFGRAAITCLDACGSCVGAEYLPSGTPDTCPGPHTAPHDATTYVSEGLGRLEAALFAFALIFAFLDVLDILLWIWTHRPVFLKAEEEKSRTAYEKVPPFYPRYSSSDAKSNGHGQQGGQKSPLLNPQQAEPAADVDGAAPLLTSAATEAPATGNRNGKSSSAPGNAYADAYYTQPTLPFPIRQIMWVQQEVHRFVGFIHRPVNASGSGSHGVRALNSGSWGKGSADSPSSGLHVLWQFLLHALGLLVHVFWHITTMAILQFDPTMLFLRIHWASALAHSGMWLTNSSGAAHLSLAVASIAGWLHVLYYGA